MYPILEFDEKKKAVINPTDIIKKNKNADYCVITFFKDVFEKIKETESFITHKIIKTSTTEHPLIEILYNGKKISILLGGLGGPLAAGLLEEVIACGYSKFIACGSSGVLEKNISNNKIIIPTSAVRDEGTSYHYLPPSREVKFEDKPINTIKKVLEKYNIEYLLGKTWTTDGFYRETQNKVKNRKNEGCICVEMEAASMMAVAKFRNVNFGQILYGGDDVSGTKWKIRELNCKNTKGKIFWLAVEACSNL